MLLRLRASDEFRCGDAPFQYSPHHNHSFEVDILSFHEAAGELSWTRKSTLRVKDVLREDPASWEMKIEIHTSLLAVHFIPQYTQGEWPDKELRIFDWQTGEEIAVRVVGIAKMDA